MISRAQSTHTLQPLSSSHNRYSDEQVFRQLDRVCKSTCLLASNTSSLDIDHITFATAPLSSSSSSTADGGGLSPARGEYLFGMHFFTPAHLMKLVEIVVCKVTSAEVLETAVAVTKRLG